ncbi:kinase-like protein [Hortaea werneckii]|nr:kinase-like protein [Hortaea werneckii]
MASPDEQQSPLDSPSPPTSPDESSTSPPSDGAPAARPAVSPTGFRSATTQNMTTSSQPLGNVNAARRPPGGSGPRPTPAAARGGMNPELAERMKNFSLSRQSTPSGGPPRAGSPAGNNGGGAGGGGGNGGAGAAPLSPEGKSAAGGFPAGFKLPPQLNRPSFPNSASSPAIPGSKGPSLAEKRGMKLPGGLPGSSPAPPSPNPAAPGGAPAGRRRGPPGKLSDIGGGAGANGNAPAAQEPPKEQSQMEKYAEFIDTKNGAINFKGKATVTGQGIEFTSGKSFRISLDETDTLDELGKGNYGTVFKVRHSRPRFRKAGAGLAGNKPRPGEQKESEESKDGPLIGNVSASGKGTTGVVMAMKEMRLELDDAKFQSIIMELDILHRCVSPYIVDFYGAFFQEGAVYICMEFMDGGSMDKLYGDGVPENVLRKVTFATTMGLKSLKEEHNIIHRDVKPTNILVNTKGQVKICDFGVSGNLVASIAKTNIGCQSYMAPERISSGGVASAGADAGGTYSVQSDIWSLGLTVIECALGRYPYPPETYDNIFSQLSAIVDGEPPDLPAERYSEAARNFVAGCLNKIPKLRPTYPMLLQHAWLAPLVKPSTIAEEDEEAAEAGGDLDQNLGILNPELEDEGGFVDREVGEWVIEMIDRKRRGVLGESQKPAGHAAPLDSSEGFGSMGGGKKDGESVKPVAVDA